VDSQRFDSLTKALVRGVTRRRAMKAVLGGAAASALGLLGVEQSQAQGECQRFCATVQCAGGGRFKSECMRFCLCDRCDICGGRRRD